MKVTDEVVQKQTINIELTQEEAWMLWSVAMYHDDTSNWHLAWDKGGEYTRKTTPEAGKFFTELTEKIEKQLIVPRPTPKVFTFQA